MGRLLAHTDAVVVLTTIANEEEAVKLIRELLDRRLIACGTIQAGARSMYRWEGKVADEVEVDVSTRAWKVAYEDAVGSACEVVIDGVRVPYLGLDSLIASKDTYREVDQIDVLRLRHLKQQK
jgi:uncharacterized protein involved in tolerance to divalent cations